MIRSVVLVLMMICLSANSPLLAQDGTATSQTGGQQSHFYVTVSRHTMSAFPVTFGMSLFMSGSLAFKSDASCVGFAVGAATTLFSSREGYAAVELGFS